MGEPKAGGGRVTVDGNHQQALPLCGFQQSKLLAPGPQHEKALRFHVRHSCWRPRRHTSKMVLPVSPKLPPRYELPKAAPQPLRIVQELVNSVDLENGVEWLGSPDELQAWLAGRGLDGAGRPTPRAGKRVHDFPLTPGGFLIANNEHRPGRDAAGGLEEAAARARLTLELDDDGRLALAPQAAGVDGALGRILAIVHEAMSAGTWHRLKACRQCAWAYYD